MKNNSSKDLTRMYLSEIKLTNFRSFRETETKLSEIVIFIGRNGEGKSNLLEAIRFLRTIATFGIDAGIQTVGGAKYFARLEGNQPQFPVNVSFRVDFDPPLHFPQDPTTSLDAATYTLTIKNPNNTHNNGVSLNYVWEETITLENVQTRDSADTSPIRIIVSQSSNDPDAPAQVLSESLVRTSSHDKLLSKLFPTDQRVWINHQWGSNRPVQISLLQSVQTSPLNFWLSANVFFFDPDPNQAKRIIDPIGLLTLTEDGNNLAEVIRALEPNQIEQLNTYCRTLFPRILGIEPMDLGDGRWTWSLREQNGNTFPARFLSPGMVRGIILLVALVQATGSACLILEEPERFLDPSLLAPLMAIIQDVVKTQKCQVIFTTQSPEILAHVNVDRVYWIRRDDEWSVINHPATDERLRDWVQDLGIANLYIDDFIDTVVKERPRE